MNALVVILLGIIVYYLGLRYARYVDRQIVRADPKKATPAMLYNDGVDFLPTSRYILFGYQFKSIAGAAPVLGPIIAIKWGWLPGLIWILLGALLIGWIQDYFSSIVALRHDGQTFGGISYSLISPRSRKILLTFIYFYLLLMAAAFTDVCANILAAHARIALALIALPLAGVLVGRMIYKGRWNLGLITLIGLILFFAALGLGNFLPLGLADAAGNKVLWIIFCLVFSFCGAVLPIWAFVQPINYLGFYVVLLGMAGAVLGIIVGHPNLQQPMVTQYSVGGLPLWPFLFVTIACGAISGWHSLVSSTGTARQLEKETDARPVTAGAMLLEMILALLALVIVCIVPPAKNSYDIFAGGMAQTLGYLGLPPAAGAAFGPVLLVILALTLLHLVVRFMRIATNEIAGKWLPAARNPYLGTLVALVLTFLLVYTGTFNYIWVLFGAANQLMASMALMIAAVYLVSIRRNPAVTFVPMVFMYLTTMAALAWMAVSLTLKIAAGGVAGRDLVGHSVAAAVAAVLFLSALCLAWDGLQALRRHRRAARAGQPAAAAG